MHAGVVDVLRLVSAFSLSQGGLDMVVESCDFVIVPLLRLSIL